MNFAFGASLSERLRATNWPLELTMMPGNRNFSVYMHTTNDATLQQVEASALILEQASTQRQRYAQWQTGIRQQEHTVCIE